MKIYLKILNLAYESIFSNAFRAFLTMLGIIIGGATIILVIKMGQGAKDDIDEQFSNMSVTTILINAPSSEDGSTSKLNIDDVEAINSLETIVISVPQLSGKVAVSGGSISESFNVLGSNADIFPMMSVEFVSGEAFTDLDEEEHNKVAVLGATVVEELFGDPQANVVGEEIVLGKKHSLLLAHSNIKEDLLGQHQLMKASLLLIHRHTGMF